MEPVLGDWVSGLTAGTGYFCASVTRNERLKLGINIKLSFIIILRRDMVELNHFALEKVYRYFNCGSINLYKKQGLWMYECKNINDIENIIIPHFKQYPVYTEKQLDFDLFCEVFEGMKHKRHLNLKGLYGILNRLYSIKTNPYCPKCDKGIVKKFANDRVNKISSKAYGFIPTTEEFDRLLKGDESNLLFSSDSIFYEPPVLADPAHIPLRPIDDD